MNIDINGLQAFARIAALGTFGDAAKALAISQSALSRRINKLEAGLGVRLLDRTTRRVRLTALGRNFLPQAGRLIGELERSLNHLRDAGKHGIGHVTFACVPTAAIQLLPPVIADYSAKYPDNRLRILDVHANEVLQAVQSGEAEFGISLSGLDARDIETETLFEEEFVLACRRDHPLAKMKQVRWSDLDAHRVIGVGRLSGNRPLLDFGLPNSVPLQFWLYEVQHSTWTGLGLAESGVGVIAVPALALAGARHPQLVGIPLVKPGVSRQVVVMRKRDASLSPAANEFLRLLKKHWQRTHKSSRARRAR
jgi:DNA-binding transcriptional LysR family regulator